MHQIIVNSIVKTLEHNKLTKNIYNIIMGYLIVLVISLYAF